MLSGAPYGYRYIRKRDEAPAAYAMIETEARVVQQVYESYTAAGWSIGAITRWLNERGVATRKPGTRWERSMGATPTGDAGAAGARRHDHSEQRPP